MITLVVQALDPTAQATECATPLRTNAPVTKAGLGKGVKYQIVPAPRTAMDAVIVIHRLTHRGVDLVCKGGWVQLVMTHVCTVSKSQWTAAIVCVSRGGLVLDATVNVPNMVRS